jgi:hypothetical protein
MPPLPDDFAPAAANGLTLPGFCRCYFACEFRFLRFTTPNRHLAAV